MKPLPAGCDEDEDLWMQRGQERRQAAAAAAEHALPVADLEDEEPLGPDDEPEPHELLAPDEAEAKRDIWNEVNKDLLEYWALTAKRREQKKKEAVKRQQEREEQERQQVAEEESRREAFAAQRHRARASRPTRPHQSDAEELDTSVMDFWQAHSAVSSGTLFAGRGVEECGWSTDAGQAVLQDRDAAPQDHDAAADEALTAALREEREEQERWRRAKKVVDDMNELFDM